MDKNAMTAPAQPAASGEPGKGAPAAAPAEPVKATMPDLAEKFAGNPKALEVLKKREQSRQKSTESAAAAATPAASTAAAAAPASNDKPAATGDEVKPAAAADEAVVIDFTKLGEPGEPDDEDSPPKPLSDDEAADLEKVKAKLTEAHKDNATQRRLKREAAEKAAKVEAELAKAQKELAELKATQPAASAPGGYLARFNTPEQVEAARQDALEAVRQLQADPERDSITLPGNRVWKLVGDDGTDHRASVTDLAFEILETSDARLKQIQARTAAEKAVADKLPLLSKTIPDFQGRYDAVLKSDWSTQSPSIALNAAVGELVTSGAFVLTKAGAKPATKPPAPPAEERKGSELPSTTPPMRPVKPGEPDVSDLRAKALKGDKKALELWIKTGGRKAAPAA